MKINIIFSLLRNEAVLNLSSVSRSHLLYVQIPSCIFLNHIYYVHCYGVTFPTLTQLIITSQIFITFTYAKKKHPSNWRTILHLILKNKLRTMLQFYLMVAKIYFKWGIDVLGLEKIRLTLKRKNKSFHSETI